MRCRGPGSPAASRTLPRKHSSSPEHSSDIAAGVEYPGTCQNVNRRNYMEHIYGPQRPDRAEEAPEEFVAEEAAGTMNFWNRFTGGGTAKHARTKAQPAPQVHGVDTGPSQQQQQETVLAVEGASNSFLGTLSSLFELGSSKSRTARRDVGASSAERPDAEPRAPALQFTHTEHTGSLPADSVAASTVDDDKVVRYAALTALQYAFVSSLELANSSFELHAWPRAPC